MRDLEFKKKGVDTPYKGKKSSGISIGLKTFVDAQTGEEIDFTIIEKEIPKDYNFHKIWLQDILNVLDSFGNKKILVLTHLLKNMRNEDNSVSGSYREIAENCKVSLPTVNNVMRELLDSNVLKKVSSATYVFNPNLILRGSADKRKNLIIRYKYQGDERKQIDNAKTIDLNQFHPNQTFFNFEEEQALLNNSNEDNF